MQGAARARFHSAHLLPRSGGVDLKHARRGAFQLRQRGFPRHIHCGDDRPIGGRLQGSARADCTEAVWRAPPAGQFRNVRTAALEPTPHGTAAAAAAAAAAAPADAAPAAADAAAAAAIVTRRRGPGAAAAGVLCIRDCVHIQRRGDGSARRLRLALAPFYTAPGGRRLRAAAAPRHDQLKQLERADGSDGGHGLRAELR
mmetsp:Transcript_38926/g.96234  ORF Transcript_38926/g.96234 Transcript_38926/m.96234 type:complete len:200 (+) Transcript_38926:650-1249(+)